MEPPSSPPGMGATPEDALSWYKSQYEQLESELAEFKESSMELERELEKDVEEAEKRERMLQERAEGLAFEVEEWKRKYKESKNEASSVQNTLEKEITSLRDTGRTFQLQLRDIEVANDDFERQARNTTSSLEDLESKYNVAVERAVLLEEEIKLGEQEREGLRIENQRLKEELADLRIEAELLQDKVRKYETRRFSPVSAELSIPGSPTFDKNPASSPNSTASSPLVTTPSDSKSFAGESLPDLHHRDPPSPPMSDASAPLPKLSRLKTTPSAPRRSRLPSMDLRTVTTPKTPRAQPPTSAGRTPGARAATTGSNTVRTPTAAAAAGVSGNNRTRAASQKLPASNSLSHIRDLQNQIKRLENRVQKARGLSKLPAPSQTPPGFSPRNSIGAAGIPSTVTIRSGKRGGGRSSTASSVSGGGGGGGGGGVEDNMYTPTTARHIVRLSASDVRNRLSFGILPNRGPTSVPDSDVSASSRPSSRASLVSSARPESRTAMGPLRPPSRSSFSSARVLPTRPQSSLGGSFHSHSASVCSRYGFEEEDEDEEGGEPEQLRTPNRRGTYSKFDPDSGASAIPTPTRRQSGGVGGIGGIGRRTNSMSFRASGRGGGGGGGGSFTARPASSMAMARRPTSVAEDLGETY